MQDHVETNGSNGPLFVVGYSRSGTKFISNILERGSNGLIEHLGELHFYGRLSVDDRTVSASQAAEIIHRLATQYARRSGFPYASAKAVEWLIDPASLEGVSQTDVYRRFLAAVTTDRKLEMVCDGTPRNAYYLNRILAEFPTARIVYMLRDPRDCVLSQKQKSAKVAQCGDANEARRLARNYNPAVLSRFWRASAANYEQVKSNPRVLLLKYEDMLSDPHSILQKLSAFAGVEGLESAAGEVRTGNKGKFNTGLTRSEVAAVEFAAGPALARYGYDAVEPSSVPRRLAYVWAMASFALKLPLVYASNIGRFGSLGHEMKARSARGTSEPAASQRGQDENRKQP